MVTGRQANSVHRAQRGPTASLWTVDVAGGAPKALLDPPEPCGAMQGSWSPDGSQIVFSYYCRGWRNNQIRVANADGTGARALWASPPTGTGAFAAD